MPESQSGKALFGAEANRDLLIHFLNAVLAADLPAPITAVELLNPYNEREFLDDKLSVVDVKARDDTGRLYQIEIQLLVLPDLPARILYGWADLYSAQLQSGEDYGDLRPCWSIWLLGETLRAAVDGYAHRLRMQDDQSRALLDHGGIWLLELGKFAAVHGGSDAIDSELTRWLKFFTEGERLDPAALPDWMQTPEMRHAMSTLTAFSDKEREYHAYQARMNYLRQQRSIQRRIEELEAGEQAAAITLAEARAVAERERLDKEAALVAEEQARAAAERERVDKEAALVAEEQARAVAERERLDKEAALAEVERLRRLLESRQQS